MKIVVVGTGYVGLVAGGCLSDLGHDVVCVDKDSGKLRLLREGKIPIYEPGLDAIVARNVAAKRLSFSASARDSVPHADVVLIAVGTATRLDDGSADLNHLLSAAREIARSIARFTVVAVKSTVPVGASEQVERVMREENPAADIAVVSNPEFLREGSAVDDFTRPDRIIVGLHDERARPVMEAIYRPMTGRTRLLITGRRDSELIKYASNAYLAMRISFVNEIADLCEAVGADVRNVAQGVGLDKRIGAQFLAAGPGFGGSCFPKDTLALASLARDAASPMQLVETTIRVNARRKRAMAEKITKAMGGAIAGKKIAVLGLTFKANTDDMREAPSLTIIPLLQGQGAQVAAHDPAGMPAARSLFNELEFASDAYEAARGADAVVVLTEWEEYRLLDLEKLKSRMRTPVAIDLRNIWRRRDIEALGYSYTGVGHS